MEETLSRTSMLEKVRESLSMDPEILDSSESKFYSHSWIVDEFLKENKYRKLTKSRIEALVRFAYYEGRREVRPPLKSFSIFELMPKFEVRLSKK